MLSMLVFNIIFVALIITMIKGIVDIRSQFRYSLKRMEKEEAIEEATLVNQEVPMLKSEFEVYQSMPRATRRKLEAEFKHKVKKGIIIKVCDPEGNIGYVKRKEYLNKIK